MKRLILALVLLLAMSATASAHFAMLLPSDDIITMKDDKKISLRISFLHPFDNLPMTLKPPAEIGVVVRGKKKQITNAEPLEVQHGNVYGFDFQTKRPGDHVFYMVMKPYWESGEGKLMIQYTKTIVSVLGRGDGWDKPVGMKAEIIPLTRPYGIWAGNVFQGRVIYRGKPVPGARVEVVFYNPDGAVSSPAPAYEMQVITTDDNGVFTYAMPREGWWGFSAVLESGEEQEYKGKKYPVEDAAVIWVYTREMK